MAKAATTVQSQCPEAKNALRLLLLAVRGGNVSFDRKIGKWKVPSSNCYKESYKVAAHAVALHPIIISLRGLLVGTRTSDFSSCIALIVLSSFS